MATIFLDHFTEVVADTALESHTPDTGTSWSKVGATQLDAVASIDRCRATGNTTAGSAGALYTISPAPTTDGVDVYTTVVAGMTTGGVDDPFFLIARYTDSSNYLLVGSYQNGNTSNLKILKNIAGVVSSLATADFDLTANDVFKAEVRGAASAVTVSLKVNGVERLALAATDLSALTGKGAGFGMGNISGTATDDVNAAWQFDDYTVDEIAAAAGGGAWVVGSAIFDSGILRSGVVR